MRAKDIVIGESYRHKDHPNYCWAKALKVLKPKEGENTTTKIVVKCEWSQQKDDTFGIIKYFSPADLVPNGEVRGASVTAQPACEASSAEGATSTVVLEGEGEQR